LLTSFACLCSILWSALFRCFSSTSTEESEEDELELELELELSLRLRCLSGFSGFSGLLAGLGFLFDGISILYRRENNFKTIINLFQNKYYYIIFIFYIIKIILF
jgi:hypothetical protein